MSAGFDLDALPAHLRERARMVGPLRRGPAELVVYWMHHAARAIENPALDAANVIARTLDLPLLVYQGLGGGHRYDSDRHHTFIMEGAREAAAAHAELGVRHVFHLARRRADRSPLGALAARAAVVVTEDFPAPPFPRWVRALAERGGTPICLVDTACVVPMQGVQQQHRRAFAFRRAIEDELERRIALPWPSPGPRASAFDGALGFEPVDWGVESIADLCASCEIDHTVGPAPETVGGTAAGLARWSAFLETGLASYDRLRNDAAVEPPRGVSRLSPYLHHGHVPPTRIAREAAAHGGSGARKFLDELIVWRELAHNFCFHAGERLEPEGSLDLLPEWARETLRAHETDARERVYSWERLARARTGEPLWDAAQRSLLVHGEMHNNVRMSWGKAFVGWTPSPRRALELMHDLNHRYALDGSDPNSHGGLLYCLGLFDRPFEPERPVLGSVRPRSLASHARRLDLDRYAARSRRGPGAPSVAVIGAGIAGLTAARTLSDQGFQTVVFERSRGVGGRTATRRREVGTFDHGAQFFTARDPRFARYVAAWEQEGVVARWHARVARIGGGRAVAVPDEEPRFVGVPGMRAVAAHLGEDLEVRTGMHVERIERDDRRWWLTAGTGERFGPFDALLVALAPEQALALLDADTELRAVIEGVRSMPCWAAMVALEAPLDVGFDAAFVDDERLAWVANDSAKPDRPPGERWVLHAAHDWSAQRVDGDADEVARELFHAFGEVVGRGAGRAKYLAGHRWRLAQVDPGLGAGALWNDALELGVVGDWCLESHIEGAFLSGVAGAGRIAGALRAHRGGR